MGLTRKNLEDLIVNLIDVDDSSTRADIQTYLNIAARDVWHAHQWSERKARGFINTQAPESTGTVTLTKDSTAVTGSGTAFSASHVGSRLAKSYASPWYRVDAVGSSTGLTLAESYVDETAAGTGFVIYNPVIEFGSTVDVLGKVWLHDEGVSYPLPEVTEQRLSVYDHYPLGSGRPYSFSQVEESSDGDIQIVLGKLTPDKAYRLEFNYLKAYTEMASDGDECVIHEKRRDLIIHKTLEWVYKRDHFQKSLQQEAIFNRALARAISNENRSMNSPTILSDRRRYNMDDANINWRVDRTSGIFD